MAEAPPKIPERVCVLDDAPVNSHIVILPMAGEPALVVCQTPAGQIPVPSDDYMRTLPVLAEIKKAAPHSFVAVQRDDPNGKEALVCSSAVECIRQFKRHFHGERE